MVKKIQNKFTIKVSDGLAKDVNKYLKDYNYSGPAEFIRDSIREKIYGRDREEEITTKKLKLSKDEEEFLFKENKDIYNKLKSISVKI